MNGVPLRTGFRLSLGEDGNLLESAAWESMPPRMKYLRSGFAMVLAQNHCVAIGGSSVVGADCMRNRTPRPRPGSN